VNYQNNLIIHLNVIFN